MAPNDTPDWTSVTQVETVPGSVVTTAGVVDYLHSATVPTGAAIWQVTVPGSAVKHAYSALLVSGTMGAGVTADYVTVWDTTAETAHPHVVRATVVPRAIPTLGGTTASFEAVVPIDCAAGDTLRVQVGFGAQTGGNIAVSGTTWTPSPFMAATARPAPTVLAAYGTLQSNAGPHTVLASVSPRHYVLYGATLSHQQGSADFAAVDVTTAGHRRRLAMVIGNSVALPFPEPMVLGPTGTVEIVATAATNASCTVVYSVTD